jgi:tetratricopeptide (TPR) repeat protein
MNMFKSVYKIIELLIDENEEAMLESISLVDKPAIERDFMYFSKEKPKYYFEDDEQRIVVGPVMVPEMRIPRNEAGEIYYVYFTKETIAKAAELFLKHDKASKQNTDHKDNFTKDIYLMESWLIEDEYDKAYRKYGFKDLPIGTWMTKMRVMDDKVWAEVKDGKYNGFSVQGDFLLGKEKYEKAFAAYKRKYKNVRKKWNKLYSGLSQEEKVQLDQILFLVELNENDYYENAELAIKRSKEIGLNGEIHSHYDEELDILIYMPGKSHEDYEEAIKAKTTEEEMNWETGGLPEYTKPGATADAVRKPISQIGFVSVNPGESKEDYIGRCMSGLQGEFPNEDQRYAVCITEWEGSAQEFATYNYTERRIISDFLRDIAMQYNLRFAAVEDLKVGDEVSWKTADQNPRGRIREIVREGSKKVPGRDFEVTGTPDNPGYIIEIYTEDAEGNWRPSGEFVGRKADSILKNVQL